MDCTTSTSFMSGTGLKKCSPSTCPGRFVAAAIAVTLHDEVFEASSAWGRQMASSFAKVSFLSGWFSVMASMTRSQSLRSSKCTEPWIRASVSVLAFSSILALATRPSRLLRSPPSPLSRRAWLASITTVGKPACAETCAMPDPMSPQPMTPTCLMAMAERPPRASCGCSRETAAGYVRPRPLVILNEGLDAIALEPLAPLQKRQLDEELAGHHHASQPLDQAQRCRHRAAGREQVVHDQDLLARADAILVDGEHVPAVLELVLLLDHRRGELALLAHGHEARAKLVREHPAEDEAARLDADHDIDGALRILRGKMFDDRRPRRRVLEQRGDVLEEDAFGGEILDVADPGPKRGDVHDGERCYPAAGHGAIRKAVFSASGGSRGRRGRRRSGRRAGRRAGRRRRSGRRASPRSALPAR